MPLNKKFFLAIDSIETSMKALQYVARMVEGKLDAEVRLFHIITPIPHKLREHGGSEDPAKEEQLSNDLREAQSRWIEEKQKECAPLLEQMKTILVEGGVPPQSISVDSCAWGQDATIDQCLLEAAQNWNAGTIVVGWDSFPIFEELVKSHIAEKLIRKGQGLAFWVVK